MQLVAAGTASEAARFKNALRAADISFERQAAVCEAGTDLVELYVTESDFDRAATLLENADLDDNMNTDMSNLPACPRCGGTTGLWVIQESEGSPVEIYLCKCSGTTPVAFRTPETKLGGLYDAPLD